MFEFLRARRRALMVAAASAAVVVLASCSGGDGDRPPLFGTMVTFGASISDTGNVCNTLQTNCPYGPPYASGRASNGPLWIEYVATKLGNSAKPSTTGGTNYAWGGARTGTVPGVTTPPAVPSMVAQVEEHLKKVGYVVQPETLFALDGVTVGNNISDALTLAQTDPQAPVKVLTAAVTDMASMILRLYAAGARHIMVVNSTNVGRTPYVQSLGAAAVAGATQLSAQFNGALAQQIAQLKATSPGLNVYLIDAFAFTEQAVANPSAFGLTNVTDACFSTATTPPTTCATPDTYFYWDGFHSTTAVNSLVADIAVKALGR
jgi:phospholipase/lecithinase/hemolysin